MSLHESHMDRSITPVKLSRPGSVAADEESGGIDPRLEHSATLKMDLVIIPLVGMYCKCFYVSVCCPLFVRLTLVLYARFVVFLSEF